MARTLLLVYGPGRSGTSLTMQTLSKMYIGMSDNLIPPSPANMRGAFEDVAVREIDEALFKRFGSTGRVPLPPDWLQNEEKLFDIKERISIYLKKLFHQKKISAIKSPTLSYTQPIWRETAKRLSIKTRNIVCVRRPNAIVDSYCHQYKYTKSEASAVVFLRLFYALKHAKSDGFIIDYDEFLNRPLAAIVALREWAGTDASNEREIAKLVPERELRNFYKKNAKSGNYLLDMIYEDCKKNRMIPNSHEMDWKFMENYEDIISSIEGIFEAMGRVSFAKINESH